MRVYTHICYFRESSRLRNLEGLIQYIFDYPNLEYPSLKFPKLDYPNFEYPSLDYPNLDYPNLDYPNLDYPTSLDYPNIKFPELDYPNLDYPNLDYPNLDYLNLDYSNIDYPNRVQSTVFCFTEQILVYLNSISTVTCTTEFVIRTAKLLLKMLTPIIRTFGLYEQVPKIFSPYCLDNREKYLVRAVGIIEDAL